MGWYPMLDTCIRLYPLYWDTAFAVVKKTNSVFQALQRNLLAAERCFLSLQSSSFPVSQVLGNKLCLPLILSLISGLRA